MITKRESQSIGLFGMIAIISIRNLKMDYPNGLLLLALSWLGYFALHSWLASLGMKRWVAARRPAFMPAYRLIFNLIAVVLLLPILALAYSLPGAELWRWQGVAAWFANGASLLAIVGVALSSRGYDMREFLGVRQWQSGARTVEDQENFHLSAFHRFVRHPWYFCALVLIWSRDMTAATLLSSALLTIYFVIGSRLEEKKLLAYHGEIYRRYMERVPGLVPLPWQRLTRRNAEKLLNSQ
jgi:protein-S-isoprenylcysteine O-methyltransferase Ste14